MEILIKHYGAIMIFLILSLFVVGMLNNRAARERESIEREYRQRIDSLFRAAEISEKLRAAKDKEFFDRLEQLRKIGMGNPNGVFYGEIRRCVQEDSCILIGSKVGIDSGSREMINVRRFENADWKILPGSYPNTGVGRGDTMVIDTAKPRLRIYNGWIYGEW